MKKSIAEILNFIPTDPKDVKHTVISKKENEIIYYDMELEIVRFEIFSKIRIKKYTQTKRIDLTLSSNSKKIKYDKIAKFINILKDLYGPVDSTGQSLVINIPYAGDSLDYQWGFKNYLHELAFDEDSAEYYGFQLMDIDDKIFLDIFNYEKINPKLYDLL